MKKILIILMDKLMNYIINFNNKGEYYYVYHLTEKQKNKIEKLLEE